MDTEIFRKKSLEQLSNPQGLDSILVVTRPFSWISLVAISLVILTALVWGIFGSIPYKVSGNGIIINSGGIMSVLTTGTGQVTELSVKTGDVVEVGQVIGKIGNSHLAQQYKNAKENLAEQRLNTQLTKSTETEGFRISLNNIRSQIRTAQFGLNILREQLKTQGTIVEEQKRLLALDLVTKQDMLNAQNTYDNIRKEIVTSEGQLRKLRGEEVIARNNMEKSIVQSDADLSKAEGELRLLEIQLKGSENIVSPYKGRVIEVTSSEGALVESGASVIILEVIEGKKEAVLYVPTASGKELTPGMNVDISPSTVKEEEYGFMRGKVMSVSEFPSTSKAMMNLLDNEDLVTQLSQGGAPFMVTIELLKDPVTFSGYKWSSSVGPPTKIGVGTICSGSVVTKEVAPISLVIPILKKLAGP